MPLVDWSMQVTLVSNCNCDYGCPCQFNSDPTHGDCRTYSFVEVEQGHFGGVPLDGLRWGVMVSWPGPIHLGNGTLQTIVDERGDAKQRAAIETVSHGKETEPGTLIWQVFSTTVTNVLPTLVKTIELSIDVDKRRAHVRVPGILEGGVAPIRNEVTGQEHRATVRLPKGFEYTEAEFASGTGRTLGDSEIKLDFSDTHAHMARVRWSTHGVVR